jgi:hypothetical protein
MTGGGGFVVTVDYRVRISIKGVDAGPSPGMTGG